MKFINLKGKGLKYLAAPQRSCVKIRVNENGRPEYVFPNRLQFLDKKDPKYFSKLREAWYPCDQLEYRNPGYIVNTCADPDDYEAALISLDRNFGKAVPIFNHPRGVARTRRDKLCDFSSGLTALTIPRTIRVSGIKSEVDIHKEISQANFSYPVLVRPVASQAGFGLTKVEHPMHLGFITRQLLASDYVFISEYVDFSENDVYVKCRIFIVDGELFLRHVMISTSWLINSKSSEDDIQSDEGYSLKVMEYVLSNNDIRKDCLWISRETGLDYLGLDVGVAIGVKRHVLFEANTAMNLYSTRSTADSVALRGMVDDQTQLFERAAQKLFSHPDAWSAPSDKTVESVLLNGTKETNLFT